ncbi:hypothetical protein K9K77_00920 [Candidatus Babeliales bacterium]|nr:hypothetical protein [Candidatus Babeliales bacterium]
MELLGALDKKIGSLIELVKELRSKKEQLEKDKNALIQKVTLLENSLLEKNETIKKEWDEERASTRRAVDELILDIDTLIEGESR